LSGPEYGSGNLDPRYFKQWPIEDVPSTRESLRPLTKHYPIDSTLAVSGTAENLYTVSPGVPTVNLITNPSAETADPPTGFTASGSAISQSAVVAYSGSNSMLINPDNAAAGEGAYWSLGSFPPRTPLVCSAYFQDNVNSGDTARIQVQDDAGNVIANGNTIVLSNAWQRSIATISEHTIQQPTTLRVYFVTVAQHNTNFYVDGMQAEVRDSVSAYCDGSLGIYHEWDGTANASTSRRFRGPEQIREYTFHTTGDIYLAFDRVADRTATNQQDRGMYIRAGSDFWSNHSIEIWERISFCNVQVGETPRIFGWLEAV